MRISRHVTALAALAALMIASSLTGCGGDSAEAVAFPDSLVDDEVIVKVNGTEINGRQVRVFTLVYQPDVADSLTSRLFNLEVLNGYIDRTLLYQEAMAGGITVDDSTHQWYISRFADAFGGKQQVEAVLGRFGITRPEFEQVIKRDLIVRRFIETRLAADVNITEADARAYFDNNPEQFSSGEAVHARHIILRSDPADTEEARAEKIARLEKLRDQARAGEDFAALARDHSEGPSAPNGGDLGYFERAEMVTPFSDAAFAMKNGEVSDVVETQFGYHIIQVVGRREPESVTWEEVRERLIDGLFDRALAGVLENHLKRTRSVAIIEPTFDYGGLTQRESTTFTR